MVFEIRYLIHFLCSSCTVSYYVVAHRLSWAGIFHQALGQNQITVPANNKAKEQIYESK